MDVASLLQGAPSTDRTRRQKQLQTPQQTHRVGPEEETRGLKADIGATAGAGSFQVVHEYVHPSVQQSRNSANYYPPQPVPQRLPIQPPPDYVDVNTESGLIRMKKEHYSQHNIHGFIAQPRPSHDHQQWPTSAVCHPSASGLGLVFAYHQPSFLGTNRSTSSGKLSSTSYQASTISSTSSSCRLACSSSDAIATPGSSRYRHFCIPNSPLSYSSFNSTSQPSHHYYNPRSSFFHSTIYCCYSTRFEKVKTLGRDTSYRSAQDLY